MSALAGRDSARSLVLGMMLRLSSLASDRVIIDTVVSKYADHVPIYAAPGIKWHEIRILAHHRVNHHPLKAAGFQLVRAGADRGCAR